VRVAPAVVRLLIALAIVAFVSWQLLALGGLPIAPHAIPLGPQRLGAQAYGVIWWIALAVGLSAATSILFATMLRMRGANGHRALPFVNDALGIVIFGIALASLSAFVFEFPLSAVFATSSIIAVTLGFAMQHTLADLLSGLAMSIEQPFRVGDRIDLGDRGGRVLQMNWRATHILAINGDLIVVPNSTLNHGRIINHDSPVAATHRSSVTIKLGNDEAPMRALDVLRAAAMSASGVQSTPPPRVEIAAYGDWAIDYKVLFYFKDWGDETQIASNIFSAVWSHLSWAGIPHPIPRTVLAEPGLKAGAASSLPSLLKRLRVFESLADDERTRLAADLRVRTVPSGANLIEQGASGNSLFVVREGVFDVRVVDAGGTARVVTRLFPGDYVGEASLLTGAPRNATVEAVTGAAVYEIDKGHLEPFLAERPEMAELFAAALVARNAERDAALAANPDAHGRATTALAAQIRAFFRL
jgi:small-conductance mechanosensitive channel/CRP-like cAMP-binding protein